MSTAAEHNTAANTAAHTPPAAAAPYRPTHPVRVVTAASLFDGHDAAIHIMRRILQATGCEVIHLGHNRSVLDVVTAAIQEDAQGIAMSSYQGGHMEYFKYMHDLLAARGAGHIRVYGGGGGTIIPEEKRELEAYGVAQIFHPEDGRRLGLQGMINQIVEGCDFDPLERAGPPAGDLPGADEHGRLARLITQAERAAAGGVEPRVWERRATELRAAAAQRTVPVLGVTGTGGAGKSSFVDELVRRYTEDFPQARVAVLCVDPTKRRTGGALLGDRIRMNSLSCGRVFMRSLATRASGSEVSDALDDAIAICKAAGFELIIAETSGIGQADAAITDVADVTTYVMTPEFGAQSQLEKIEMIDLADVVVLNKFDKPGALDALRDVRKAYQRAHSRFAEPVDAMPVFASMASLFNDRGVNEVYAQLLQRLGSPAPAETPADARATGGGGGRFTAQRARGLPHKDDIIPGKRVRYLAEIADAVRGYKQRAAAAAEQADRVYALAAAVAVLRAEPPPALDSLLTEDGQVRAPAARGGDSDGVADLLDALGVALAGLDRQALQLLAGWPALVQRYRAALNHYTVRGRTIEVENTVESLSGQAIAKVALPRYRGWGDVLRWRMLENVPGAFPFTAGVFPFRRRGEDPTRMFAGEGGPWRTNKRFHYLSRHSEAKRLSTAFDSVTLYGEDPDRRPDIWGKVGNSGVSIATVEDMEALYAGFDLCSPTTSVSMTINGPAPTILAFYFNAAVRQQLRRHLRETGALDISEAECLQPNAGGLDFAALRARVDDETWARVRAETVARLRGTVQADILKEDQAQNTCIFSTGFALTMMGDIQQWFIDHGVRNFYSVSISGYHIAEAGANPITQLAFTLANGFTFVEYYLARGMDIDAFAPNLSFFFSNGMDPEYTVIGRVARRIWAVAMRERYGASERSQKLKYHIQTSGRSLHAQEIAFNDIRTTLQALLAIQDSCNSLHTNAYDEAITTPTEASVRRALAIQLIVGREFGLAKNENPNQGSFIVEELTELVEEAVLSEFERLTERGGVLGAMERMYQRSRIQEESMVYEHKKHTGELPIIGVNTFTAPDEDGGETRIELARSTEEEKEDQLRRLQDFHARHADRAGAAIDELKRRVLAGHNTFDALMDATEVLSLGQVSRALYEVGGQYRRNM